MLWPGGAKAARILQRTAMMATARQNVRNSNIIDIMLYCYIGRVGYASQM